MKKDLTIAVIDDDRHFAAMREEWTELVENSTAGIFLTWEWLHTWWAHFGKQRRLFIVTVRSGSRLIAIAPLTVSRAWGIAVLEFAGTGIIGSDYLDVIVRRGCEQESLTAIADVLADCSMSIRLPRVSASSALAIRLASTLAVRRWQSVEVRTEVCPFIDLTGRSFETYLGTVSASHRYNFKRRLKNLQRDHDVRVVYAQTDDERREALRHVVSLHLERWHPRGGSDAFNGPAVIAFHEDFSRLAQDRGWLRLMTISVDGRPAAAFYGFRYRDTFSFYQSGFDPAYERSSVGLVMIGLTIRDAIAEGALEYDFLHGDEPYKFLWTKTVRQLIRFELYPPGNFGVMHRNARRVTAATRRLAKRVLTPAP